MTKHHVYAEIVLVFAVFFIQGAWPVPDVNEPYYLGKAIHYWNPDSVGEDFFLDSSDTHKVFYFTFGWLSLWLPPVVLAWFGRVLTWGLLAWAWRRLSFAVLPGRWWSVLTAALLVCLVDNFNMAGEWIVGGVEAKGFAYVLVLLGLEALVRRRWNRAWLLFGAATMFHVLVGGWAAVAGGLAWLFLGRDRPTFRSMWPGLLGGLLLSLPSLGPSLALSWGVDAEIARAANRIYVFERVGHHLDPWGLPAWFLIRFGLLTLLWAVIRRLTPSDGPGWRLHAFVAGAVTISLAGLLIAVLLHHYPALAAGLLRFYWFRLADVAVPLGVALGWPVVIRAVVRSRPGVARICMAGVLLLVGLHLGYYGLQRPFPTVPRAARLPHFGAWLAACNWIAQSDQIPPDARFLTPRMSQTFKWYTGHSEVVTWKDIPQDARSIVQWWQRMHSIHAATDSLKRWHDSLAELGAPRLEQSAEKYDADYVLTVARPRLDLTVVYDNSVYVVYRIDRKSGNISAK